MMKAANTIQGRMLKALAIVVVSALVLGGMSLYAIFQSHQSAQSVSEDLQQNARQFLELRVAIEYTISNFALIAANKGASGLQNLEAIRKAREDFLSSVNTMIDQNQGKNWLPKIEELKTNFNEADSLGRESALAFVDGKIADATAKQEILQTRLTEIRANLNELSQSIAAEHQARLYGLLRSLLFLIFPILLMSVLIPFVYLVLTGRKLNQELLGFVSRLQNHSEQNDRTSQGLRAASTELSSASKQQSAAVQESVASIAQIRSMLAQTSSHVHEAQSLASNVNDKTKDGGKIMARMETAMSSIEQSNAQLKNIAEIIEAIGAKTRVINDIVFKTQLLSFNASIEAARAGQYGRGFAVVAEEVGKLAQLSGSASHEIDHLLRDSLNRVDQIVTSVDDRVQDGKEVSSEALKRFTEIARQIELIRDKIDQVGHATAEQENGISQTARSMDQMDHSALSNKKSAENMSKLAEVVRSSSVGILDVTTGIRGYVRLNSKAS